MLDFPIQTEVKELFANILWLWFYFVSDKPLFFFAFWLKTLCFPFAELLFLPRNSNCFQQK